MRLSLALLGPFHIQVGDEPIPLSRARKIEALLIYLAVESDRPHSRDFLDGLLFPEMSGELARSNLRQTLSRLRRAIRDEEREIPLLSLQAEMLGFNRAGDYELDMTGFLEGLRGCSHHPAIRDNRCPDCMERLQAAMAVYRGPFLEGFFVQDSEAFESWMLDLRDRLNNAALEACRDLADYHEGRGEYELAVNYARRQVRLEPWREEAHGQLMRLLARRGQRSAALAQYERCCRILKKELGADPGPELSVLLARIRAASAKRPHNLPVLDFHSFVGRERELGDILGFLIDPERRWLTLVGPGGIGKTGLALRAAWPVASDYLGPFMDGVYFVPLVSDDSIGEAHVAGSLVMAIIQAMGLALVKGGSPQRQLLEFLKGKECLLIIDNGETLEPDSLSVLEEILRKASGVQLLITSRCRMNLAQEWVLELDGLPYPPPSDRDFSDDRTAGVEPLGAAVEFYGAVRLFTLRAGQANLRFAWNAVPGSEQAAVVRICQITQGMPLALEMAAAWVRMLSCEAIASEIRRNLDLLTRKGAELPLRHRCIQAVFESSLRMLSSEDRRIFGGLAVFRGGFSREAAEQVAGAGLQVLCTLRDWSLLQVAGEKNLRYQLHPLLRQFMIQNIPAEEWEILGANHAQYYGEFLAKRQPAIDGNGMIEALQEIRLEIENIRSAWRWAVDHRDLAWLGRTMHPLYGFYGLCTWWDEGREMFEDALARVPDAVWERAATDLSVASVYGGVLLRLAEFNYHLGALDRAEFLLERSQHIQHRVEDPEDLALVYEKLGLVAHRRGDCARALKLMQFSLEVAESAGLTNLSAHILMALGAIERDQGRGSQAQVFLKRSLTLYRSIDYPWGVANALRLLGGVTYDLSGPEVALSCYEESLKLCQDLKNPILESLVWNAMGQVMQAERQPEQAKAFYHRGRVLLEDAKDDRALALTLENLGHLALELGELEEARVYLRLGLESAVRSQDTLMILKTLIRIACLLHKLESGDFVSLQAVDLIAFVCRHPACSLALRQEIDSLEAELKIGDSTPDAAGFSCWDFSEIQSQVNQALARPIFEP